MPLMRVLRGWVLAVALAASLSLQPASGAVTMTDLSDISAPGSVPNRSCVLLAADGPEGAPEGDQTPSRATPWFCPTCLTDPRYDAGAPLKRIEQRLIPRMIEVGDYTCDGFCQRWLLRPPSSDGIALMLVRVGVPTVCGATGWCPGRIYERRQGNWKLVGSYSANEANELCVVEEQPGHVKLRLWSSSEPTQPLELDWRY